MVSKVSILEQDRIVAELTAGRCVAMPTETVYGLMADATNGEAVARIFEMKQRPQFNPLISHVSNLEMARSHGMFDTLSELLAKEFWPGPLTLVVPANPKGTIHPLASAGLSTIGLRCPQGPSRPILEAFGKPLAGPSANRSGRVSPTRAEHVLDEFPNNDLLVMDGEACEVGIESTIVRIVNDEIILLRPGSVTASMIEEVTGIVPRMHNGDEIEAPGMMKSHYAPNAGVLLDQKQFPEGAVVLAFGPQSVKTTAHAKTIFNLSKSGDLREAAANLYHALKLLDAEGTDTIYAQPVPSTGLGIAINDRLSRAAAPRSPSP